jgi:plastocyanin
MRRVALGVAVAGAVLAAPAWSTAMDDGGPTVAVQYAAFQPQQTTVLAGRSVMWHNESARAHTVTADDGSYAGALFNGGMYSHTYDSPGTFSYHCTIHPTMRGEVDVYRLLLDAAGPPVSPGDAYVLTGRAAVPAGSAVSIEGDSGSGFQRAGSATVGGDGSFSLTVRPSTSTTYRAVAGSDTSPAVLVQVLDRSVRASIARHGRTVVIGARVRPSAPRTKVMLQLHLPEHFGWWPVRSARLDRKSRARFVVHTRRAVRARVVLTRRDGITPVATSRMVRVGAVAR